MSKYVRLTRVQVALLIDTVFRQTSGVIDTRDKVEERLRVWMGEQRRRERTRERLKKWRVERKMSLGEHLDMNEGEGNGKRGKDGDGKKCNINKKNILKQKVILWSLFICSF